ncbi:transcriptional regulator, AbrB family [Desulfofarcimen acetoxidans DSM 771]|jgi:AbrB family transcriptional regulator (stage V sporulation protein T)|uniref:Transcriptional regulator, AbrB family n=1 Tax=Desulfofarcimen acetoxidans (strain ATCC 49208 / DSM 771 / KCTC 5769 / VKM B-1644 / 5575) TaxID=485916 RepID=C8W5E4_DESAS|nr:stage V sporulation T C-terminal domain-containing protein [Desulfofarcimen acetoxidans]ACV62126.1 transcriptional regulator, AbrB family [Desulfofarcimen acetoxidans DSM 771]
MKATGVVRRIDDLGRVVIPKEIRRTLRINNADPLEVFVDGKGKVILKKYEPIQDLSKYAKEYAASLFESLGRKTFICDEENIIAAAGIPAKQSMNKDISDDIKSLIKRDEPTLERDKIVIEGGERFPYILVTPVKLNEHSVGAIIMIADEEMGGLEINLTKTAANFLAKQLH